MGVGAAFAANVRGEAEGVIHHRKNGDWVKRDGKFQRVAASRAGALAKARAAGLGSKKVTFKPKIKKLLEAEPVAKIADKQKSIPNAANDGRRFEQAKQDYKNANDKVQALKLKAAAIPVADANARYDNEKELKVARRERLVAGFRRDLAYTRMQQVAGGDKEREIGHRAAKQVVIDVKKEIAIRPHVDLNGILADARRLRDNLAPKTVEVRAKREKEEKEEKARKDKENAAIIGPGTKADPNDDQDQQNMAVTPITDAKRMDEGVSGAKKVMFADGTVGILKPMAMNEAFRSNIPRKTIGLREVAAYRVDQAIGANVVPPTVLRTTPDGSKFSVQKFVADAKKVGDKWNAEPDRAEGERMRALDFILAHADRHGSNWMITKDNHIVAIDNGLSMPTDSADFSSGNLYNDGMKEHTGPLLPETTRFIAGIQPDRVKTAVRDLEIDAQRGVMNRVAYLQKHPETIIMKDYYQSNYEKSVRMADKEAR